MTVSGDPPLSRDYVTVCNLANKVRTKHASSVVLAIHSNRTVMSWLCNVLQLTNYLCTSYQYCYHTELRFRNFDFFLTIKNLITN